MRSSNVHVQKKIKLFYNDAPPSPPFFSTVNLCIFFTGDFVLRIPAQIKNSKRSFHRNTYLLPMCLNGYLCILMSRVLVGGNALASACSTTPELVHAERIHKWCRLYYIKLSIQNVLFKFNAALLRICLLIFHFVNSRYFRHFSLTKGFQNFNLKKKNLQEFPNKFIYFYHSSLKILIS